MDTVTTSRMRTDLCAAICKTVMEYGTPDDKRQLADRLDAMPFERMGDNALIGMAREYVAQPVVDWIIEHRSADRYEVTELFVCHVCRDHRYVVEDPDAPVRRMDRCPVCNPKPDPAEAEAAAPKRGRR